MIGQTLATCIFLASQTYSLPPAVLVGISMVEGGKVGQQVKNKNGSYDLGPMQINTLWLPELAKTWGVSRSRAWQLVRDDACTNVHVAAWILRKKTIEAGSLYQGIAHYHSKTPKHGLPYRKKVVAMMHKHGLMKRREAIPTKYALKKHGK